MEVLDLSVGEKNNQRNRRKANAPRRRSDDDDDDVSAASLPASRDSPLDDDDARSSPDAGSRASTERNGATSGESRSPSPNRIVPFHDGAARVKLPAPDADGAAPWPTTSAGIGLGRDNNNNNNKNFASLPGNIPLPVLDATRFRGGAAGEKLEMTLLTRARPQQHAKGPLMYGDDVQATDTPGIPERTKKQNRWAFNVWREWARKRNVTNDAFTGTFESVPVDVGQANEVELDFWLSKFVQEIRRKDGQPYPPHTLMQIVMGIQRYLRQQAGRPNICILDRTNHAYRNFRLVLDQRIKELTSEGVSAYQKSARAVGSPSGGNWTGAAMTGGYPDEDLLWEAGICGDDSALKLLNAVFYHNTVTFGIRSIDDHWNLKMRHFKVGAGDVTQRAFVEFTPTRDPLFVGRGLNEDKRRHAEPANRRCVVALFHKYISLLPSDGPFYRHPQEPTIVDRSIRFSDQWVGKNRLRAMIKHIFASASRQEQPVARATAAAASPTLPRHQPRNNNNNNNEDRQDATALAHRGFPTQHHQHHQQQQQQQPAHFPMLLHQAAYGRLARAMLLRGAADGGNLQQTYSAIAAAAAASASEHRHPFRAHVAASRRRSRSRDDDSESSSRHSEAAAGDNATTATTTSVTNSRAPSDDVDGCEASVAKRRRSGDSASSSHGGAAGGDDVTSCIADDRLEIVVPRAIRTVTLLKGGRRHVVTLD